MLKLNCGLSYPEQSIEDEIAKIKLADKYGIDYVSVISIDEPRVKFFWELIAKTFEKRNFTLCSAPLYECAMFHEDIMDTIKRHYSYGVRAMTFHVTSKKLIDEAVADGFIVNSRGGIFSEELKENPIIEKWLEITNFCIKNDIQIFIGTSLRPGACEDKISKWTKKDLEEAVKYYDDIVYRLGIKKKIKYADEANVQLEAMGHVRYWNFDEYKKILGNRNICSMGPLLTDSVNGFDELNAIIGYTLARREGLNITTECMLSRKEHIEMPNVEDVEDEIKKWRVAETCVDVSFCGKGNKNIDKEKEVLAIKGKQRTQCSAHYNIFGAMDIIPECNVCGSRCPLKSEKLKVQK